VGLNIGDFERVYRLKAKSPLRGSSIDGCQQLVAETAGAWKHTRSLPLPVLTTWCGEG